jgi:hypothetical protein
MLGVPSVGIVIALAVLVIAVLALLLKLFADKPNRAEKWERAEIMKQLLALSERDSSLPASAPSVRLRPPASGQGMRTSNAHLKTTAKTTRPIRSKIR